jgi:putative thiamine transport system ATP-binding protein
MSLELDDVTITLHGHALVRGLNARVAPGEVLAVMGESGSGKSTLLAWMCGTLAAPFEARGALRLDGRALQHLAIEQRRIGLMFQDDLLFPHMSVLDNLLFALPPGPLAARRERAEQALASADLQGFGARRPASLSGGQRARISLLRTLLAEPRALLLDEPFSRLDAALRERFRAWVWSRVAQQRLPTVLVTHDAADVPAGAQVIELASAERAPRATGGGDA